MSGYHAKYSPSGAHGWSACSGWESNPQGSDYADWGTACHALSADCIVEQVSAEVKIGAQIDVHGVDYTVDAEMAECAQFYIDYVRMLDGKVIVEQPVGIGHMTGEDGATGTADAVAINPPLLVVADLKTGYRTVDAYENPQLAMYAEGVRNELDLIYEFERVRMVIVQPRLMRIDQWEVSIEELADFVATIKPATTMQPGEHQCTWCLHSGSCRARAEYNLALVEGDFEAISEPETVEAKLAEAKERLPHLEPFELAALMPNLDMIIDWCNAVRAEVTSRILGGKPVPGYKPVAGKKGDRAWSDALAAEKKRKRFSKILPKELFYTEKIISPTAAEKLLKKQHPDVWKQFEALVVQPNGKIAVVPDSDKRPALELGNTADDFEAIDEKGSEE